MSKQPTITKFRSLESLARKLRKDLKGVRGRKKTPKRKGTTPVNGYDFVLLFAHNVRSKSQQLPLSSASPVFMIRVKALILGLMVAVVATDLLKRALSKSGLTYEPAIAGCLFISVMVAYACLIERSPSQHSADQHARGEDQP